MIDFDSVFDSFKTGDASLLYREMYSQLLGYARKVLGEELDIFAADCVQDAVMNTYLHIDELHSISSWHAYLLSCIHNKALKYVRKQNARHNYEDSDEIKLESHDFSIEMIRQETLTRLFAAIDSLPEELRQIFDMSFEQGLKTAEIAEALCVSERTVKSRKHRMLDLLRSRLGTNPDDATLLLLLYLASSPVPN